jgi:hypothetical protein
MRAAGSNAGYLGGCTQIVQILSASPTGRPFIATGSASDGSAAGRTPRGVRPVGSSSIRRTPLAATFRSVISAGANQ